MIADREQHRHAMRRGHARGERERTRAAFKRGERLFETLARRVCSSRIIEFAPLARARLRVSRRYVDRRNERSGRRIRLVANVDRAGAEMHWWEFGVRNSECGIR